MPASVLFQAANLTALQFPHGGKTESARHPVFRYHRYILVWHSECSYIAALVCNCTDTAIRSIHAAVALDYSASSRITGIDMGRIQPALDIK